MKKIILASLAACAMIAVPAQAQFTAKPTGGNSGSKIASTATSTEESYGRFGVNYSSMNLEADGDEEGPGAEPWNGVSLYWTSGKQILQDKPVFLEWGMAANLNFYTNSESKGEGNYKYDFDQLGAFVSLEVPVNIGYKINLSDGVNVMPYAGLHAKGNLYGAIDNTVSYKGESETETYDFFDKDDVGSKKNVFKRVQFGWQIGAYVDFNKFYINAQYGADFGEISPDITTNAFCVGIGVKY